MRRLLNPTLLALLLVLIAANLFLGDKDPELRNFEVLPTMVHSVPYEAFSSHPDLPRGMTMQPPAPGTIPRTRMPAAPSAAQDARGEALYGIYCQLCHGPTGAANGPVAQRGFPAPPAFNSETSLALEPGQILDIITFGQNNMPAHATQLDPHERWLIVRYVENLRTQLLANTPAPNVPDAPGPAGEPTTEAETETEEAAP